MVDVTHPRDDGIRRSQSERRAETIDLLLEATIAAIADRGYHQATTAEICRRAGVSPGALFHHFDTRLDLVDAALQRLVEQRIERYLHFADSLHERGGSYTRPSQLLRMVRELASDRGAMVWLDVTVAARTDRELGERIGPSIAARWAAVRAAACGSPAVRTMPPGEQEVWLQFLRSTLELDAIFEQVDPHPELDERKDGALLALAVRLGASYPPV